MVDFANNRFKGGLLEFSMKKAMAFTLVTFSIN